MSTGLIMNVNSKWYSPSGLIETNFECRPDRKEAQEWLNNPLGLENRIIKVTHIYFIQNVWPGGHPMYYITADGGVLCPQCANDNISECANDNPKSLNYNRQWAIVAGEVNYENNDLYCDNCNKSIESAYGVEEEGEEEED